MKKKIIIGILIIIEIGLIMVNYNTTLSNKEIDKIEAKEETKEIKGNNTLAIMVKSKDGKEYTPSETNTWPESPYKYAGALCIGNDGRDIEESEVISFDNASHTATITTKDTIYCYLYFAEGEDAVTRILSKSASGLEAEEDVGARGDVLRRFQGTVTNNGDGTIDNDINNYICFGTSITEECVKNTDRYKYRIIGYATADDETTNTKKGQLKLIKKEALEEAMQWHYNSNDNINWFQSDLYNRITTKEYLTNKYYVPSGWENKIAEHIWWTGNMSFAATGAKQVGSEVFKIENGQTTTEYNVFLGEVDKTLIKPEGALMQKVNDVTTGPYKDKDIYYKIISNQKWTEKQMTKVGLMNISDYYLSVSNDVICSEINEIRGICKAGWLHLSNNDDDRLSTTKLLPPWPNETMMADYGFEVYYGLYMYFFLFSEGNIDTTRYDSSAAIRPVIYTTENITLNGSGTITDPYIIVS